MTHLRRILPGGLVPGVAIALAAGHGATAQQPPPNRPFVQRFAHSMPYIPLTRSSDVVGHSSVGVYGDVIEEIDWSTGRFVDALDAAGIGRQTPAPNP
jgi:arylsulfatase A-like enzyme